MKIGLISDIHGNLEAVQKVLERLKDEKCGKILCAGDIVGYGPQPQECIELMQAEKISCVLGNHDEWAVLTRINLGMRSAMRESVLWTRHAIDDHARDWLATLPRVIKYGGLEILHATSAPTVSWTYVSDQKSLDMNFKYQKVTVCVNGHTHVPIVGVAHPIEGARFLDPEDGMILTEPSRYLVNPGAVGQPRDGDPRAACAIYETRDRSLRFFRVDYNIRATQDRMRDVGASEFFIDRLAEGR